MSVPALIPIPTRFNNTEQYLERAGTSLNTLQEFMLQRLSAKDAADNPNTAVNEKIATPEEITGLNLQIQMAQSRVTAIKGVLEAEKNHTQGMSRNG